MYALISFGRLILWGGIVLAALGLGTVWSVVRSIRAERAERDKRDREGHLHYRTDSH